MTHIVNLQKDRFLFLYLTAIFFYAVVSYFFLDWIIILRFIGSLGDPDFYLQAAKNALEIGGYYELRPQGQGPIGVGIVLLKIFPGKTGIILFNSVVHVTSVFILIRLLRNWFSECASIIGSLPLAISPYMMLWYSQLNKESLVLLGALLFSDGLLGLLNAQVISVRKITLSLIFVFGGVICFWMMRPYINQFFLILIPVIFFGKIVILAFQNKNMMRLIFSCCVTCIFLFLFQNGAASDKTLTQIENNSILWPKFSTNTSVASHCIDNIANGDWNSDSRYVEQVNMKLKALMGRRCLVFIGLDSSTNLTQTESYFDQTLLPKNSNEALYYIFIGSLRGLFTPFVSQYSLLIKPKFSFFYLVTIIEQAIFLISLIGVFLWIRKYKSLALPFLCTAIIAIYGVTTPFMGALYRYRYPWYMLLMAIGISMLVNESLNFYNSKRNNNFVK